MLEKDSNAPIVFIQYHSSPCGKLILGSMNNELCLCDWNDMPCAERNVRRIGRYVNADFRTEPSPVIEAAKMQLDEYFAGARKVLDIPLHPLGSDFQMRVWRALLDILYGQTWSYMEIAKMIDNA